MSRSVAFLHPVATNFILSATTPEGPPEVLGSDAVASVSGRMRFRLPGFPVGDLDPLALRRRLSTGLLLSVVWRSGHKPAHDGRPMTLRHQVSLEVGGQGGLRKDKVSCQLLGSQNDMATIRLPGFAPPSFDGFAIVGSLAIWSQTCT